jgi:hypothetical protein
MARDPREARTLGLWTATWLAVLLVAGLLWLGNLAVQWPVLLVPVLWALVALRPRRRHLRPDRNAPRGWEVLPPTSRTEVLPPPSPTEVLPPSNRTDTVERRLPPRPERRDDQF